MKTALELATRIQELETELIKVKANKVDEWFGYKDKIRLAHDSLMEIQAMLDEEEDSEIMAIIEKALK